MRIQIKTSRIYILNISFDYSIYIIKLKIVLKGGTMNNKDKKILREIFSNPIKSNIKWIDIESLFISLGANISEGNGSRVRVELNNERAVFHRPHPENTTDKGAVRSVRRFLENAGVII